MPFAERAAKAATLGNVALEVGYRLSGEELAH
jgi:hypothetical protein